MGETFGAFRFEILLINRDTAEHRPVTREGKTQLVIGLPGFDVLSGLITASAVLREFDQSLSLSSASLCGPLLSKNHPQTPDNTDYVC